MTETSTSPGPRLWSLVGDSRLSLETVGRSFTLEVGHRRYLDLRKLVALSTYEEVSEVYSQFVPVVELKSEHYRLRLLD